MRLKHPDELEAESKKLREQSKLSVASTKEESIRFKPVKIDYSKYNKRDVTSVGTFD